MDPVKILALSDEVDATVYTPEARSRFGDVDLVIGCGDLPYDYLVFVATQLPAPLYAVHGNHDVPLDQVDDERIREWWESIDLDGRVKLVDGLLVGGFGGSPRYSNAAYQRSESDLWLAIIGMMPALVLNRIRRGRFLDVLVTHAPPRGIHDRPDQAHQGFRALRWFLRVFRPRYHLHGHTHIYDQRTVTTTRYHDTTVINAYGAREVDLDARP